MGLLAEWYLKKILGASVLGSKKEYASISSELQPISSTISFAVAKLLSKIKLKTSIGRIKYTLQI